MKLPGVSFSLPTAVWASSTKRLSQEKEFSSLDRVQSMNWVQRIVPSLIVLLGISVLGCSVLAFCTCLTVLPGLGLVLLGSLLLYWAYHQIANMRVRMALSFEASSEAPIQ
ncbi:hypothetical protein FTN73_03905 [Chlamydia trachomatis]|uniref:Uncharacterized protein n=4 Tax=Chlamydia trachomatis TaxID=813 RepID=O84455_CHLTR|nr:hypothetical protein [Chlamydia trachomatis]NP_219962.1 hypothetical protein CT_449 [Chlamydia trachomatis D/UW-3/CX]AAC68049.1 hypothetical protein CT_449 [Chlamydia trachomatis D/UW-3/CX]AAX50723.1 hypothetical membrane associated protein [Chlamydia trachomatis A/HAR-13]ADH18150.1 hypothetical protein G9768_02340 [Chlamydia trachomatis G/9768]ADH19073.1 hypothetical protein G11222_02345 [Chlamydia trachomatis G/11222]ADH19998.1 hypothetical protein G11074_02345 [Chlamydia trachomatis G/1